MPLDTFGVNPRMGAILLTLTALTIPSALFAQSAPPARDVPFVQPVHPASPRPPVRPSAPAHRPGQGQRYPIVIDGSVVNRYLATPVPPAPKPTHKPTPRPKGAPDVFETHSTGNE